MYSSGVRLLDLDILYKPTRTLTTPTNKLLKNKTIFYILFTYVVSFRSFFKIRRSVVGGHQDLPTISYFCITINYWHLPHFIRPLILPFGQKLFLGLLRCLRFFIFTLHEWGVKIYS